MRREANIQRSNETHDTSLPNEHANKQSSTSHNKDTRNQSANAEISCGDQSTPDLPDDNTPWQLDKTGIVYMDRERDVSMSKEEKTDERTTTSNEQVCSYV